MTTMVQIGNIKIGGTSPLLLIAGPCVIENYNKTFEIASYLKELTRKLEIPFVFKASYDKANRTSINSFRGPGLTDGLDILRQVKADLNIPVLSDVHSVNEVEQAAEVLDIIQIPAFLCRQTDLIIAVSNTQKPINIKKGQFLAPGDIQNITEKVTSTGNRKITITERGTSFGYNNLVVDFRSIKIIQESTGFPVIFDATHSVQLPGGSGIRSGGQREFAPILAKAAVAAGADGIFIEVYPDPDTARCDGPNSLRMDQLEPFLFTLKTIRGIIQKESGK